jgi:uncharacterized protein DUF6371/zinc ribbon protein
LQPQSRTCGIALARNDALLLIMQHRYILEPYSGMGSRIMCPQCRHRRDTFKRYMDTQTQTYLADHVGRCDRQERCGYHYPPRQYFADNPGLTSVGSSQLALGSSKTANCQPATANLTWQMVEQTMKAYHRNNFVSFLVKLFGEETAKELVLRYCIGTASHWPGATVFWQLDYNEQVRAGKVMLYNAATGKRVKQPFNHITWVHSLLSLKSKVQSPESDIDFRLQTQDFRLKQCLFGEHLLAHEPDKIVALTESEKTAIIGSAMEPEYVWLASGSLEGLSPAKCKVLQHRTVLLYPDVNGYGKWKEKARELNPKIPTAKFGVNKWLLRNANAADILNGADVADKWIEQLTLKP